MANRMDYITKGSSNKAIFSINTGEIRDENSLNPKTNSGANAHFIPLPISICLLLLCGSQL